MAPVTLVASPQELDRFRAELVDVRSSGVRAVSAMSGGGSFSLLLRAPSIGAITTRSLARFGQRDQNDPDLILSQMRYKPAEI
jgi:hypothetical protein